MHTILTIRQEGGVPGTPRCPAPCQIQPTKHRTRYCTGGFDQVTDAAAVTALYRPRTMLNLHHTCCRTDLTHSCTLPLTVGYHETLTPSAPHSDTPSLSAPQTRTTHSHFAPSDTPSHSLTHVRAHVHKHGSLPRHLPPRGQCSPHGHLQLVQLLGLPGLTCGRGSTQCDTASHAGQCHVQGSVTCRAVSHAGQCGMQASVTYGKGSTAQGLA